MSNKGRLTYVVRCSAAFSQDLAPRPPEVNLFVSDALPTTMETWFPGKGQTFSAILVLREGGIEEQRTLIRGTILRVRATQTPGVYYDFRFRSDPGEPVEKIRFRLMRSNIEKIVVSRPNGTSAEVHNDLPLSPSAPAPPPSEPKLPRDRRVPTRMTKRS